MDRDTDQLIDVELIAFDLETTGLHALTHRIIEIAAVRFRGDGTVLEQFEQLIDPGCEIPAEATTVHGLRNCDVDGKPTIAETLPRFLQFLGDAPSIMMAHNASFDMGFLTMAWGRLGQPTPSHTVVDTIPLARERLPLRNYKLETIGRHLGLIDDERHRALDDSMLLKNVFVNLVEREPAITTLAALFDITPELSFQHHEVAITQPPLGFEGLAIAISEGQSIKLVYDGGTSPGSPRIVTPLAFVKEGGRIYLSALCHKSRIEKSYRLDRIVSFERKSPSTSLRKSANRSSSKGKSQPSKPKPDGHG